MREITIVPTGHVGRVDVRGPDIETDDCIGRAVARAEFPQFSGPPMPITYPYVLR
jgi:hypothetical protein